MTTILRPYLTISAQQSKTYERFKSAWHNCQRCPLRCDRSQVVHVRGQLPCRVLFIGEAPGKSEDALGYPFIGEAGYLMQEIIEEAQEAYAFLAGGTFHGDAAPMDYPPGHPFRYAITNIVACLPLEDDKTTLRTPKRNEAEACSVRLLQLSRIAQPQLIVLVGKPAAKLVDRNALTGMIEGRYNRGLSFAEIIHPSAILRTGDFNRTETPSIKAEIHVKRSINTIVDALHALDLTSVSATPPGMPTRTRRASK